MSAGPDVIPALFFFFWIVPSMLPAWLLKQMSKRIARYRLCNLLICFINTRMPYASGNTNFYMVSRMEKFDGLFFWALILFPSPFCFFSFFPFFLSLSHTHTQIIFQPHEVRADSKLCQGPIRSLVHSAGLRLKFWDDFPSWKGCEPSTMKIWWTYPSFWCNVLWWGLIWCYLGFRCTVFCDVLRSCKTVMS